MPDSPETKSALQISVSPSTAMSGVTAGGRPLSTSSSISGKSSCHLFFSPGIHDSACNHLHWSQSQNCSSEVAFMLRIPPFNAKLFWWQASTAPTRLWVASTGERPPLRQQAPWWIRPSVSSCHRPVELDSSANWSDSWQHCNSLDPTSHLRLASVYALLSWDWLWVLIGVLNYAVPWLAFASCV